MCRYTADYESVSETLVWWYEFKKEAFSEINPDKLY